MVPYCLSGHADYICRHSGACCTSNWPIHVESERLDGIRAAVGDRRLVIQEPASTPFEVESDLPAGAGAVLGINPQGACVFYDGRARRCQVHRALGHGALPSACQHFPRRCLIERDAVYVSLSHYCPTVARMAVAESDAAGIVAAPASLVGHLDLEGLDARNVLPPLLTAGMLTDLDGYHAWEHAAVAFLQGGEAPREALWRIGEMTNRIARWKPGALPLSAAVKRAADESGAVVLEGKDGPVAEAELREALEVVRQAIPPQMRPAWPASSLVPRDARWVAARWARFGRPLGRYLAAHAFGNWSAYLGASLATVVRHLEAALALVRVESGRLCLEQGKLLDEAILAEAFRAADLLLVHLADPAALAAGLDRAGRPRV